MSDKTKTIILWVLTACLVAVGSFNIYDRIHNSQLEDKEAKLTKDYEKSQQEYNKKFSYLEKRMIFNANSSQNPMLKSIANNNSGESLATNTNQTLFKVIYNFKTPTAYQDRPNKLKSLVGENVLQNKDLFGDDKSVKAVSVLGLVSEYRGSQTYVEKNDNHAVVSIVRVEYQSGYQNGNHAMGARTYEVTYDKGQQKITDVKLINAMIQQGG